ncbi:YdcH family protein [Phaeobacter sp. CNT1-3]|nr:YdcH family protein [Phaeobacter sp. CNT1-3]
MGLTSHIEELKKKHSDLSQRVEAAQRAPGTSDAEIAEMKKQKLRLKEEITRLSAEPA